MPKWRKFCKDGEEPSELTGMKELQEELGCKHEIGWSQIPREWLPAVKELVENIRKKYTVDGSGIMFFSDNPQDIDATVRIAQIKDKFGSLRFYFDVYSNGDPDASRTIYEEVEALIDKCEERLAKDDPYYGEPY